jgi:general secretion pathway protein G
MATLTHQARRAPKQNGFTLIEIIAVLIILGGLMAVIVPRISGAGDQAKVRETKIRMEQVRAGLDLYKLEVGRYPEQLQALVTQPSGVAKWSGPYVKGAEALKDAWSADFRYTLNGNKFTLTSLGSDGKDGGSGNDADISESN